MNKEIIKIINLMAKIDQEVRFEANDKFMIYMVDAVHQYRIHRIIDKYGYPTKSMLGDGGLKDFWLLIQHMDLDVDLQVACLRECDFSSIEYAHLYDRVQVNKRLNQKYGTQLNKPILNLQKTNEDRKKIGWVSVEEYIEKFNSEDTRRLELNKNEDGSAEYIVSNQ